MKRFLTKLLVCIGLVGISSCAGQVRLGKAQLAVPAGWKKEVSDRERINLISADERQQATFSMMTFDTAPKFDDFKRISAHRLDAEKAAASDITIMDDPAAFEDAGTFGKFFSGKEASSGRLFSGFVTQKGAEVITIYLESIGIDNKKHVQTFESLVKTLKWREL
jgi:hypothetical protein